MSKKQQNVAKLTPHPMSTDEGREQQLIAMAIDCAEQQLLNGTASSQVITHFLKLATAKERLEKEKLERENELLRAKTEALKAEKTREELYRSVLDAIRCYSGQSEDEVYED